MSRNVSTMSKGPLLRLFLTSISFEREIVGYSFDGATLSYKLYNLSTQALEDLSYCISLEHSVFFGGDVSSIKMNVCEGHPLPNDYHMHCLVIS